MENDQFMTLLMYIGIMLPTAVFLIFIPYLTRKTESFGVSIPSRYFKHDFINRLRRQYAGIMALLSAGSFALIWVIIFVLVPAAAHIGFVVSLIAYLLLSFLVYLYFHFQMKEWKKHQDWAREPTKQRVMVDTRFRSRPLNHSSHWLWIAVLFQLITVTITFVYYERIPQQIPLQYDLSGNVTNWVEKSYTSVLLLPALQLLLIGLFLLVNWIIVISKQQIDPANPEQSLEQNVIFRRAWSAFIIVTGIGLTALLSIVQASIIFPLSALWAIGAALVFTVITVGGAIILSIRIGQGGSRITFKTQPTIDQGQLQDDQYWKLGQFYFNPQDPSLFVEKRFGVGWTINMAKPLAWLILVLPIVISLILVLLLTR